MKVISITVMTHRGVHLSHVCVTVPLTQQLLCDWMEWESSSRTLHRWVSQSGDAELLGPFRMSSEGLQDCSGGGGGGGGRTLSAARRHKSIKKNTKRVYSSYQNQQGSVEPTSTSLPLAWVVIIIWYDLKKNVIKLRDWFKVLTPVW